LKTPSNDSFNKGNIHKLNSIYKGYKTKATKVI